MRTFDVLKMLKENVRSGWMVTTAGVRRPGSRSAVRALNSLAKSIAFTPFAPSAGPTGGCAEALPAGTISFTIVAAAAFPPAFDMLDEENGRRRSPRDLAAGRKKSRWRIF